MQQPFLPGQSGQFPAQPMPAQQPQMGMGNPYMNAFQPRMNYQPMGAPAPQQNNGIIWVQGIEGAKAFQLAPNSNVMLLDSEVDGRFYIKTSDNIGMCNLRVFRYEEIVDQPSGAGIDLSNYVTRDELETLLRNALGNAETSESTAQESEKGAGNGKQSVSAAKSK